ncbi:hypothetical protein [Nocardia sp. NPDC051570]|uniref:hypothetical protein n=1 Tax=Nocardia sp. NPDC051570 TaxID=3364324 RepID=UPI003797327C
MSREPRPLQEFDFPYPRDLVLPQVKEADFVWARENPDKWMYYVDPSADKSALTNANVIGGRLANGEGEFVDRWINPEFVPTPQYAGVEFANEFELVMWRTNSGFTNIGRFLDALARSRLTIVLRADDPDGQRGWPFRPDGDQLWLDVYTSAGMLPRDTNPWLRRDISGRDVLEQVSPMDRVHVFFNPPDKEPGLTLVGEDLTYWWRQRQEGIRLAAEAERAEGP